ncbi:hypothetical protein TNIN_180941 [Trichonephila inaurata madagascariensis]|uniref:Uncharacterized protein n=1 Tax=Trichonephila inaurata madagascariensis TaxID=2747483 RepID=A0A8X6J478_9ARAC|nr:hypothetical protein TNIN_180941 [Trichonephila inaurata madagascariensis]
MEEGRIVFCVVAESEFLIPSSYKFGEYFILQKPLAPRVSSRRPRATKAADNQCTALQERQKIEADEIKDPCNRPLSDQSQFTEVHKLYACNEGL